MEEDDWRAAWDVLKNSGEYEYVLGDLILPAVAHCTEKDILIFNTSPRAHSPIFSLEPDLCLLSYVLRSGKVVFSMVAISLKDEKLFWTQISF